MANKMIDLSNIARLAAALDSRMKSKIEAEELRAKEEESNLLQTINRVEKMLGGKSFVYLTQAEYDELTEEEKSNDEIIFFITDVQDASHTHDNKEFLDGLSEDSFEEISAEIGALETSMSNKVSRVEAMLGGKSFVYLTQAEYDELSEEDKNDETKIYVVTDTVSMSHTHNNKVFLDSLNEDVFNDIDSAIQLLENDKLDASIYNEVVPGLVDNSHTHKNQDFLDDLNEEDFAQMNADISALKTAVSGKADTEHNHDDKYYTESEINGKIEDINEAINGHVSTLQGAINTAKSGAISESKTYTDTAITNLVDSAPDAMNTLNDLAKAINAHQTEYEAYVATVSASITSAKNEVINDAANKDEALHTIISKEIDDDVKEEHDRAVGVEAGLQASITSLTNNKVDVAKYNDEVHGLLTAKHSHENLDALNLLTSDKISGYDASIKSLQDNKLDADT